MLKKIIILCFDVEKEKVAKSINFLILKQDEDLVDVVICDWSINTSGFKKKYS